jgi:DNA polymerase sigma
MADISLGATNGAAAVDFVRRQVLALPPLRPLCLVAKAFLRERGLNEVFTGGLSSYSVINMVLAHLQVGEAIHCIILLGDDSSLNQVLSGGLASYLVGNVALVHMQDGREG